MTVNITLSDDGFEGQYPDSAVIKIEEDGTITKKRITINSLIQCFSNNIVKDNSEYCTIGRIPDGFYNGSVQTVNKSFYCNAVLILKKKQRIMNFFGKPYYIPLPTLAFSFFVEGNQCVNACVFAIADTHVQDESILYQYPLGNVFPEGKICWGECKLPEVQCLADLPELINIFLNSNGNSDLYEPIGEYKTLEMLLEQLKKQNRYVKQHLKRDAQQCRLKDLLK